MLTTSYVPALFPRIVGLAGFLACILDCPREQNNGVQTSGKTDESVPRRSARVSLGGEPSPF